MNSKPFIMDCLINSSFFVQSLIDTGCLCFSAFSAALVRDRNLPRIQIPSRSLQLAENNGKDRVIDEITFADFDIDGRQERIYGYVISGLSYDVILGKPWMEHNDVVYLSRSRTIRFGQKKTGLVVREANWYDSKAPTSVRKMVHHVARAAKVTGVHFLKIANSRNKIRNIHIFAVTLQDINKALEGGN